MDGSNEVLGPRNVSHRVAPALMPDGSVLYTEWRHLGDINDGHLRFMNTDMTGMREAFGGEGSGVTNSYLKARYVDTRKAAVGPRCPTASSPWPPRAIAPCRRASCCWST